MRHRTRPQERDAFEDFVGLALKFCALVRSSEEQELSTFLSKVASLLGELYGRAFLLPAVSPATNKVPGTKKDIDHRVKRYNALHKQLSEKLGTRNRYWMVFDPEDEKSVVSTALSDDLADICLDLEDGLAQSKGGQQDFLWQLRFDFRETTGAGMPQVPSTQSIMRWRGITNESRTRPYGAAFGGGLRRGRRRRRRKR